MSTCALCREDRILRRSHILPEFAYRPVYDDDHSVIFYTEEDRRRGIRHTGYWDKLLCDDCERHIGRWEDYFAKAWFGYGVRPRKPPIGWLTISGLNYPATKLLFLSIFWRASVATHKSFAHLTLGPHQERIRLRLLNDDPGPPELYPIMALGLRDHETGEFKDTLVNPPVGARIDGHTVYRTLFGGVFWYCAVSSHTKGSPVSPTLLSDDTLLLHVDNWDRHPDIRSLGAQLRKYFPDDPE